MLDHISFLLSEAFVALRRNALMTFAAISTVAVSLFLLGGLAYIYIRLTAFAENIPTQFEIRVHLKDGTKFGEITQAAKKIRAMPGVAEVRYIPKDKAWEKMKQDMPEETKDLENPLPDSFKVKLNDLAAANNLKKELLKFAIVDPNGVVYFEDAFNFVDQVLKYVRWLGGILGGLLFVTAGVLIHNAIRLTVLARRREIRIMQLVGATQATVGLPFMIEGMTHGVIGGCLASLLLWSAHISFELSLRRLLITMPLEPFPVLYIFSLLACIGAAYGLVCSAMAVREPLKLR